MALTHRRDDGRPGTGTQISLDDRPNWSRCSRCLIEYFDPTRKPACPLCKLEVKLNRTVDALKNVTGQLEILERENRVMVSQVDITTAIRAAVDLLGNEDRAFLKAALYQFRLDKSVALRVVHNAERKPIGLLADWRHQQPEAREFTSIGGRAIVGYYEEAINSQGGAKAMNILTGALQSLLPGGR